jgi:hypothetical protein
MVYGLPDIVRTAALLDQEHRCQPGLYSTGFYEPPKAIFQLCSPEISETIHKRASRKCQGQSGPIIGYSEADGQKNPPFGGSILFIFY